MSRSLNVLGVVPSCWCGAFSDSSGADLVIRPVDGEGFESDRLKARFGKMPLECQMFEQKIAPRGCYICRSADGYRTT